MPSAQQLADFFLYLTKSTMYSLQLLWRHIGDPYTAWRLTKDMHSDLISAVLLLSILYISLLCIGQISKMINTAIGMLSRLFIVLAVIAATLSLMNTNIISSLWDYVAKEVDKYQVGGHRRPLKFSSSQRF